MIFAKSMAEKGSAIETELLAADGEKYPEMKSKTLAYLDEFETGVADYDIDEKTLKRTKTIDIRSRLETNLDVLEDKYLLSTLATLPVTKRLGLTSADSANFTKVQEAFAKTAIDQLLVMKTNTAEYAPTSKHNYDKTFAAKTGEAQWQASWNEGRSVVFSFPENKPVLAKGALALLWEIEGNTAIVVTFDGGRYLLKNVNKSVTLNLAKRVEAPMTPAANYLTQSDIEVLEASGSLKKGTARRIANLRQLADSCASKVWKKANYKRKKIDKTEAEAEVRKSMHGELEVALTDKTKELCGKHLRRLKKVYGDTLSQRAVGQQQMKNEVDAQLKK